jgi:hypothetical protein
MSISNDPDVFKILLSVIAGLFCFLEVIALKLLADLKDTDKQLFERQREIETKFTELHTEHKLRHKCDE